MEKSTHDACGEISATPRSGFNFNKLQAVACMLVSAAVSIGLIAWAVYAFL